MALHLNKETLARQTKVVFYGLVYGLQPERDSTLEARWNSALEPRPSAVIRAGDGGRQTTAQH